MPVDQYEEHLAHSAPCNSRWDGFDRGDVGDAAYDEERLQSNLELEAELRAEGLL